MSLGIHRKHFLTAADRVRIQKSVEQEERQNFVTIELDPSVNPFGKFGVMRVDDSINSDSADATYDWPMLKATPSTEFNFTSDDDFTIHWWIKPDPDRVNPSGSFGFKLDDYGTIADWPEGSTGYTDHPFDSEPQFGRNGYAFAMSYRLGSFRWSETYLFSSKTPGQDSTDIHYFGNRHEEYDSAGAPVNFVNDWNHCAVVHKAGVGLSVFINGNRVIGPVNISIKRCVRSYGLHLLSGSNTAYILEGLYDSAGTSPLTTNFPIDLTYPATEDFEGGFNHDDFYLGPFQVKRTAIFDPNATSITVPTTEPTSDDDTVLLLLFRYNASDDIIDVVDTATSTRIAKTVTPYLQSFTGGYHHGLWELHSKTSVTGAGYFFEHDSIGEAVENNETDLLSDGDVVSRLSWQYQPDSAGAIYPYAKITPGAEFNFDHNDDFTFEWFPLGAGQIFNLAGSPRLGFYWTDPDTHRGYAFTFREDRFNWFSNTPDGTQTRRIQYVHGDSVSDSMLIMASGVTPPDSAGERFKQFTDSAGAVIDFVINHIAVVHSVSEGGLSLYVNGVRMFGPVSIHITKTTSQTELYWGSLLEIVNRADNYENSADEEILDYDDGGIVLSTYDEDRNGFFANTGIDGLSIDQVRISNVARYTGFYPGPVEMTPDSADQYKGRFYNDANTLLLLGGILDDSAGTVSFVKYESVIQDNNTEF